MIHEKVYNSSYSTVDAIATMKTTNYKNNFLWVDIVFSSI